MNVVAVRNLAARLVVAAACAAGPAMPSSAQPPALDRTAWVLAWLPGQPLAAGSAATLTFEAGRASGSDGCNRFSATYAQQGAALTLGHAAATTRRACLPDVNAQAEALMSALARTRSHRVAPGSLELLDAGGAVVAAFTRQPASLGGTSWRVTSYNNGRQAIVSVAAGTTLTMEFSADRTVSGSAGCNRYLGPYASDGSALSLGPLASTRLLCAEPAGVMEQEQTFLQALDGVAAVRFEGDRLELRTAAGALAVTLVRAPAKS